MRHDRHWALIADGQRARVMERLAPAGPWRELEEEAREQPDPPARAWGADRPGRVFESVGAARHAVEPRQDPHEAAKADFARELAERMAAAHAEGRFTGLALVAPPAFLGHLRRALPPALAGAVIGSLDKDLTRHTAREIAERLEELRA